MVPVVPKVEGPRVPQIRERAARRAVRAPGLDAGHVRLPADDRVDGGEPPKRDARDGEVRRLRNRRVERRRDAEREPKRQARRDDEDERREEHQRPVLRSVTPQRVVAREVRERTVDVQVVTGKSRRRVGRQRDEQRLGEREPERHRTRADETRDETRDDAEGARARRLLETTPSLCSLAIGRGLGGTLVRRRKVRAVRFRFRFRAGARDARRRRAFIFPGARDGEGELLRLAPRAPP